MGVDDRDYMRDVPVYRELIGRGSGGLPPTRTGAGMYIPPPSPPARDYWGVRETRPWAWIALGVIIGLYLIARQLPVRHPAPFGTPVLNGNNFAPTVVLPAISRVPSPHSYPMQSPRTVEAGSTMTATGTLDPNVSGVVTVEGRWPGTPWYRLASTNSTNGGYRVVYQLSRPGVVQIRIALPDGNYATSTITVLAAAVPPGSA